MSNVFPRHTRVKLPVAASGNGCYLVDATGKQYLDGSGGAAVSCLGHDNKAVKLAIQEQLDRFAFARAVWQRVEAAPQLQRHLRTTTRVHFLSMHKDDIERAGIPGRRVFFDFCPNNVEKKRKEEKRREKKRSEKNTQLSCKSPKEGE